MKPYIDSPHYHHMKWIEFVTEDRIHMMGDFCRQEHATGRL